MIDFLLASQFVIWTGLILIICALYVLSRQVALLSKRVPSVGALAVNNKIAFHTRAPRFEKASIEDKVVLVGGTREKDQLLFFIDIGCPICRSLVQTVKKVAREERVDLVFISDGEILAQHLDFYRRSTLMPCDYLISDYYTCFGKSLVEEHLGCCENSGYNCGKLRHRSRLLQIKGC